MRSNPKKDPTNNNIESSLKNPSMPPLSANVSKINPKSYRNSNSHSNGNIKPQSTLRIMMSEEPTSPPSSTSSGKSNSNYPKNLSNSANKPNSSYPDSINKFSPIAPKAIPNIKIKHLPQ